MEAKYWNILQQLKINAIEVCSTSPFIYIGISVERNMSFKVYSHVTEFGPIFSPVKMGLVATNGDVKTCNLAPLFFVNSNTLG